MVWYRGIESWKIKSINACYYTKDHQKFQNPSGWCQNHITWNKIRVSEQRA